MLALKVFGPTARLTKPESRQTPLGAPTGFEPYASASGDREPQRAGLSPPSTGSMSSAPEPPLLAPDSPTSSHEALHEPRPGTLLKRSMAHFAAADLDGLVRIVKRKLKKIQYRPHLIDGCRAGTGLKIEP
jgi:hypothetical protein